MKKVRGELKDVSLNTFTDRYVLLGSRRPSGGTAVIMEITRILLSIRDKGENYLYKLMSIYKVWMVARLPSVFSLF